MDVINKRVSKHANDLFEIKLLVSERSVPLVILNSLLSSPANKDCGQLLGLKITHHNTTFGEVGFILKATAEDIDLVIEMLTCFNKGHVKLLLLPEELPQPNMYINSSLNPYI